MTVPGIYNPDLQPPPAPPSVAGNDIAQHSAAVDAMIKLAELPRCLMGGSKAMRRAAVKYLPKEPGESQLAYDNRLNRSTLFNAFGKTVADFTGKIFAWPIALAETPAQLTKFAENIDLTGRHFNVFARDIFYDGLQTGGGYILVDMPPPVVRDDGAPATLADEAAANLRPYMVYIPIERMIGWKSTTINGAEVLTQVRLQECVSVPSGDYLETEVDQIRVLEPGRWSTYRQVKIAGSEAQWQLFDKGTTSLAKIALVPFYTNRKEFMTFTPPLEKLADINVAHWQSQSDQRNILHVARVPILFGAGWATDDVIEIGAGNMVRNSDPAAKLTYTEHSGAAIGAGDTDLDNLQDQMAAMGSQLLVAKPVAQTATGEISDDNKETAPLAMMARSLGDALEEAFGLMGEYIGLAPDSAGSISVNTRFSAQAQRTDLQQLLAVRMAGDLSQETLWDEMQRRDYLSDTFDPEVEKERIAAEAPALTGPPMNLDANPNAPDNGTADPIVSVPGVPADKPAKSPLQVASAR